MHDTLSFIVKSLVENPDEVHISEEQDENGTQLSISVAQSDMGRIIGKEGKVIRAIRNAMKIKAMKQNQRINISLAEQAQQ